MSLFGENIILAILILVIAVLYASVGQAGGSGYLALMGLAGLDPSVMKPTAPVAIPDSFRILSAKGT